MKHLWLWIIIGSMLLSVVFTSATWYQIRRWMRLVADRLSSVERQVLPELAADYQHGNAPAETDSSLPTTPGRVVTMRVRGAGDEMGPGTILAEQSLYLHPDGVASEVGIEPWELFRLIPPGQTRGRIYVELFTTDGPGAPASLPPQCGACADRHDPMVTCAPDTAPPTLRAVTGPQWPYDTGPAWSDDQILHPRPPTIEPDPGRVPLRAMGIYGGSPDLVHHESEFGYHPADPR